MRKFVMTPQFRSLPYVSALMVLVANLAHAADVAPVQGGVANLSPQNTKIQFVCAHVGARPDPRKGGFAKFTGKAQLEGQTLKSLTVDIDPSSIGTEFEKLTNHLKSPDFFEVRKYPTARFESTKIEPGSGAAKVTGNLTLHGVTKEISFPATVEITDAGLKLQSEFTIDRTEFGINYDPSKVEKKVTMTVVIGERT
jgi:polyisoprenoid-binding protein YceI